MRPHCLQIIIKKFRKNSSLVTNRLNKLTYSTLQCDEFIRQLITGGIRFRRNPHTWGTSLQ